MSYLAIGRALAALFVLAAMPAAAQTMYKWVDEKGTTHFSESPPPDEKTEKKASKVTPKVTPPSGPVTPSTTDWKAKDAEFRQRQIERGQQDQAEAKDTAKRQAACDRARSRVAFLRNTNIIYRDKPDGGRTYMDESERAQEISAPRTSSSETCRYWTARSRRPISLAACNADVSRADRVLLLPASAPRPRWLVLAWRPRGFAHIGVLKVLEEAGIHPTSSWARAARWWARSTRPA